MTKKWITILIVTGLIVIGLIAVGPLMSDVKTPDYTIVESQNNIEIREYAPMIIAEVEMKGQREDAIKDGFSLLADYIFGNNTVTQEIAMTAPVQQQKSSKIPMTAPVQQEYTKDAWKVSFVMPAEYTMEKIPKPIDKRVILKEIPSKRYVAIIFSGTSAEKNLKEHKEKLMNYIQANNLSVIGPVKYAFYNPPWTLPPMRRNEVMIEIQS